MLHIPHTPFTRAYIKASDYSKGRTLYFKGGLRGIFAKKGLEVHFSVLSSMENEISPLVSYIFQTSFKKENPPIMRFLIT
jgi:hypothetical protein